MSDGVLVRITTTGVMNHTHSVVWPKGWPPPREGDKVEIRELPEVDVVRTAIWYPEGTGKDSEPFLYVVLGPRRYE